jgi:hypothetical protein
LLLLTTKARFLLIRLQWAFLRIAPPAIYTVTHPRP